MDLTIEQGTLASPLIVNKYVNTMDKVLQKISARETGQITGTLTLPGVRGHFLKEVALQPRHERGISLHRERMCELSQDQKQGVSEELGAAGAESEGVGKPAKV